MAGEYGYPTKVEGQHENISCGSPLAVQGIFLEILRQRFGENSGMDYVWSADPTTASIQIEAGYNEVNDIRDASPAIYVDLVQCIPTEQVLANKAAVSLPDHKEAFYAHMRADMQFACVSADMGESAILGDIVQWTFLAGADPIERAFGFKKIQMPFLGATQPYERAGRKYNTGVNLQVEFPVRWVQTPINPLLQQIAQRVNASSGSAEEYFNEITINSLRRVEPDDGF